MSTYRFLTTQVEPDPDAVRVETIRGEQYLVAPVVAVAEGVLNGGFLPFEEIALSAPGWNGQPVTVTHPEDGDGNFVPANRPEVLEEYQIGRFLGVEADPEDRKLSGELWIRQAAVQWLAEDGDELGDEASQTVEMLKEGDPLEVSTGYWHGVKPESGEFEGQEYEQVQVDVLPDHLAVLPNAEGACNWEGSSTAAGCGAPRTNLDVVGAANAGAPQFAANCSGDECSCGGVCQHDGQIDAALHAEGYDPAVIDAANLLEQARVPEFGGTSSEEWSAPTLDEIASAFDWEDADSIGALDQSQRERAAQLSLLGDADAETFDELVFFPVVEPASEALNENALDAVLSGRGAQADISDQQLASARGVARNLLEEEFDRELDDQADAGGIAARVGQRVLEAFGLDVDGHQDKPTTATAFALNTANPSQRFDTMGDTNPDRLESIANSSTFDVDELEEMDDEVVDKIEASLEQNDDGGDGGSGDGGSGDGDGDQSGAANDDPDDDGDDGQSLADMSVEDLREEFQTIAEDVVESKTNESRRSELVDAVTSNSKLEEDDLPEDVEKLEAMAEKLGAQTATTPNYGGRAAGTNDDDELEVEVDGYWASQEAAEQEEAE